MGRLEPAHDALRQGLILPMVHCAWIAAICRFLTNRDAWGRGRPIYVSGVKTLLNRCIRICVMEIELSARKGEPYLASFVRIRF